MSGPFGFLGGQAMQEAQNKVLNVLLPEVQMTNKLLGAILEKQGLILAELKALRKENGEKK